MANLYLPLQLHIISYIPDIFIFLANFILVCKKYKNIINPRFNKIYWEQLEDIIGYNTTLLIKDNINKLYYNYGSINFNSVILNKKNCIIISRFLGKLTNLKGIYFWNNQMTLEGFKILAEPLSKLTQLNELYLGSNNVSDTTCIFLAPVLEKLVNLKWLNLCRNNIGSIGCYHLSKVLKNLKKLEHFALANNHINNEGCFHLKDALIEMDNLEHIYFNNNNITEEGYDFLFNAFSKMNNLKNVHLLYNYNDKIQIKNILYKYKDSPIINQLFQ